MPQLPGYIICPIGHSCCYGLACCAPGSCCDGNEGPNFGTCYTPTFDECTEEVVNCVVVPKNNGCNIGAGEHPCGTGCCTSGEACDGGCFCIPI